MKILLATSAAIPSGGGIASYNQELVKSLGLNNDFYLLTSANEHDVEGYSHTETTYNRNIHDYRIARKLVEEINNECYDLIINSDSEFVSITAPFLNSPIVSVAHFVNGILADRAGYNNTYLSAIIALSNYGKEYLDNTFRINNPHKTKVIYNFVNKGKYVNEKINNKKIIIVYPGGTSIKKSVDVVMEAAYRLKRTNLDFSFYWLGNTVLPSSSFSIIRVKSLNQMIHGDSRFIITGRISRENAESIISSANVFLLPSRGEGCPMTLLEAMRSGCIPIVSDAHHGSLEVIKQSQAGLIVKQGDSKSIFNLLVDIIDNHSNYIDYYYKTRDFSEHELNSEKWVEKMLFVMSEVLKIPKNTIEMSYKEYHRSLDGYLSLMRKNRKKEIINSVINRIKMDWLYLKWHGWK